MAIECTYCEEKVNAKRGIYIKCTTCQDIKLCLECFSAGATIAEHESDHPYELVDCGSFPIIDESWKAHEELALLEAIELYGIGSWTDISTAVGTRSAEECCERYLRVYVDNFFGRTAWNAIERNLYTVHDHTCTYNQPLSPSLSLPEKHKIVDITREQQLRLGYMPRRDDFEREYDNDAEFLVSKLAVNANDDTDLDQDLKVAHINMYTDKLRERFRRKRIVLEYNLVKLFFHMHPEEIGDTQNSPSTLLDNDLPHSNTLNSDTAVPPEKAVSPRSNLETKLFSESNRPDTENSVSKSGSTATPKNNPSVINTILNYFRRVEPTNPSSKERPNAPETSILSSYFSNLNKTIAEQDFNTMEKKLRIFCQFSFAEEHNKLIRNLAREKELKVKIKDLIKKRKNGLKTFTSVTVSNSDNSDANSRQSPSTNKKNSGKNALPCNAEEPMDVDTDESSTLSPTKVTNRKTNGKNESTKAITNLPLNQNNEPSWRLLSESEKRLCKSSNLKPSQYISLKAFIISEHNQKKKKKGAAQRLFADDIDKTVKRRIVDFLTRNNWIKV